MAMKPQVQMKNVNEQAVLKNELWQQ